MALNIQQSQDLANQVEIIKLQLHFLDIEYAKECADAFANQANRQEAMAVLNPRYSQSRNQLLRSQAKALFHLVEFVEALKEADELKKTVKQEDETMEQISQMFV